MRVDPRRAELIPHRSDDRLGLDLAGRYEPLGFVQGREQGQGLLPLGGRKIAIAAAHRQTIRLAD